MYWQGAGAQNRAYLEFVYASDGDWVFCCTCGLHVSQKKITPVGRTAPWSPTAVVAIDPKDWQPRSRRQPRSFRVETDSEGTESNVVH